MDTFLAEVEVDDAYLNVLGGANPPSLNDDLSVLFLQWRREVDSDAQPDWAEAA